MLKGLWQWMAGGGTITQWMSALVALFGGGVAVVQYRSNSRRNKAIKAADEIDLFLRDPRLRQHCG
jgi:hypothetical protein